MKKVFVITILCISSSVFSMDKKDATIKLAGSFLYRAHDEVPGVMTYITNSAYVKSVYNITGRIVKSVPWDEIGVVAICAAGLAVATNFYDFVDSDVENSLEEDQ